MLLGIYEDTGNLTFSSTKRTILSPPGIWFRKGPISISSPT
jgi:hypothetical protein